MRRVLAALFCVVALAGMLSVRAHAGEPSAPQRPQRAERVSRMVQKLGSGNDAIVAVRLRNRTVLTGWVADLGPESFEIVNEKNGERQQVFYSSVDRLAGYNTATGVQVQEGTGIRGKLAKAMTVAFPTQQVQRNNLAKRTTLIVGIIIGVLLAIILAKVL